MNADALMTQLKSTLVQMAVSGLITRLAVAIPALATGPLGWIATEVITLVAKEIVDQLETMGYFTYVDFYTQKQAVDFANAAVKNAEVQANGTDEEKASSQQALIDRARDLIRFNR